MDLLGDFTLWVDCVWFKRVWFGFKRSLPESEKGGFHLENMLFASSAVSLNCERLNADGSNGERLNADGFN